MQLPIASLHSPTLTDPPPRFVPGQILYTPGALEAMESAGCMPIDLLIRHLAGDWGNVDAEDAATNDEALRCGFRLVSSYEIALSVTIWLITAADRSATTFLLPEEY